MRELPWSRIGSFELSDNRLVVSDPCYRRLDGARQGHVVEARPGAWIVSAVVNRSLCLALQAVFARALRQNRLSWSKADFQGGVDSAQFGFFDARFHQPDDEAWYALCCRATGAFPFVGVLSGGAVAASGYGDGAYPIWLARDTFDLVIGVRVLFRPPSECRANGRVLP